MGKQKSKDKRLIFARYMPPLYRTQPGQPYSYKTDEVFHWLSERPTLINYLFDVLRQNGYLIYDENTGKWQGTDYDSEE